MEKPRFQKKRRPAFRRRKPLSGGASSGGAPDPRGERLQKVLALAGIGSRRKCEEVILAGRVEVDGELVRELGTRVHPGTQRIAVDGNPINSKKFVYYLVNKPEGFVCTTDDPAGRARVLDLLPATKERLFTVGRLDLSSEGLILVTNDGNLANQLAHPRYGVEKTYLALVAGIPSEEVLQKLHSGIYLAEGVARAKRVRLKRRFGKSALLEIVLAEGKNREIRRVLAKVGHKVMRLKRISIGPLKSGGLKPGDFRQLRFSEIATLRGLPDRIASKRRTARKPKQKSQPE